MPTDVSLATFASGCFWCTEAVFERIKGVIRIQSGYAGSSTTPPTYEQVSLGNSGFTEAIQLRFNPKQITYEALLTIFFSAHDPTTLNRQGNDVGSQYALVIYYHSEAQKIKAKQMIQTFEENNVFNRSIVTRIEPFHYFYPAEDYHQKYFQKHPEAAYCQLIIKPKVQKINTLFSDFVK